MCRVIAPPGEIYYQINCVIKIVAFKSLNIFIL